MEEVQGHRKEVLSFLNDDENFSLVYDYIKHVKRIRHAERSKTIQYVPHCYNCLKLLPKSAVENDLCDKCMRSFGMRKVTREKTKR